MCGIAGISYGPDGPEAEEWTPAELMSLMFPAIVSRGPHAWGWMAYDGGSTIEVARHLGRADTKKALRSLDIGANSKWVVGHVRWATTGSPSYMGNNHPIPHGDIVGVHNGVISNYRDIIRQTGRQDEHTEVDSEAIFAAVNKWGHVRGLNRVRGDMVAVYVDRRQPFTLRIARTSGRPLVLARTPTGATIFASIPEAIWATGIDCTAPSPMLGHRLLSLRRGRIVRRAPLEDHTPRAVPAARICIPVSSTPMLRLPELSPQAQQVYSRILQEAEEHESARKRNSRVQPLLPPRRRLALDDLYWIDGMLVDKETYEEHQQQSGA